MENGKVKTMARECPNCGEFVHFKLKDSQDEELRFWEEHNCPALQDEFTQDLYYAHKCPELYFDDDLGW